MTDQDWSGVLEHIENRLDGIDQRLQRIEGDDVQHTIRDHARRLLQLEETVSKIAPAVEKLSQQMSTIWGATKLFGGALASILVVLQIINLFVNMRN